MEKICYTCMSSKVTLSCGHCKNDLCKNCAQFIEADTFSFRPNLPAELSHQVYCSPCRNEIVDPAVAEYEVMMAKAKNVNVYFKGQGKETRLMRRVEKPITIEGLPDKEGAVLRLAFLAALKNFTGLIDVEITSKKVIQGRYQSMVYDIRGVPFNLDDRGRPV